MKQEDFYTELNAIVTETNDKVVELVHRAQKENGLDWDTDQPLPFYDNPQIQRRADDLASIGGWIYDRLQGINRMSKKSMTKKIRKALGYSYP